MKPSDAGNRLLVGYVTATGDFDPRAAAEEAPAPPAAMVPRIAVVDTLPTRTSGKIDREALPWLLPVTRPGAASTLRPSSRAPGWVAGHWAAILGSAATGPGRTSSTWRGSLTAAQLVSRLRERYPEATVADVYEHPVLADPAASLDAMSAPTGRRNVSVAPVPLATQVAQVVATVGVRAIGALRWLTWIAGGVRWRGPWSRRPGCPTSAGGGCCSAGCSSSTRSGASCWPLPPPACPAWGRAGPPSAWGRVHLRLWLAERLVDELGATSWPPRHWSGVRQAPGMPGGAGRRPPQHPARDRSAHPGGGLLGRAGGRPGRALARPGHLHVGAVWIGADARVGARSTLWPGLTWGMRRWRPGQRSSGPSPPGRRGPGAGGALGLGPWPLEERATENRPVWLAAYAASAVALSLLPVTAVGAGTTVALSAVTGADSPGEALLGALAWVPLGSVVVRGVGSPRARRGAGVVLRSSRDTTRFTVYGPGRRGRCCG